jgi:hypothetical protein
MIISFIATITVILDSRWSITLLRMVQGGNDSQKSIVKGQRSVLTFYPLISFNISIFFLSGPFPSNPGTSKIQGVFLISWNVAIS